MKASEVCEIAKLQPYVLRTWEAEFPELGVAKAGGPRLYRQSDLEQVLRIKQLVFAEGLTLAGARRKLDEQRATGGELPFEEPPDDEPAVPLDVRAALANVKQELRGLLAILGGPAASVSVPSNGGGGPAAGEPMAVARKKATRTKRS